MEIHVPELMNITKDAYNSIIDQITYLDGNIISVSIVEDKLKIKTRGDVRENITIEIIEIIHKTRQSFYKYKQDLLKENIISLDYKDNPMHYLKNAKMLIENHDGAFTQQGEFLQIRKKIDNFILNYALSKGAQEQSYPLVMNIHSMIKNSYIKNFPHHCMFISNVHHDLTSFKNITGGKDIPITPQLIHDNLSPPEIMLPPTVCYHCFEGLKDQKIKINQVYTAINACYRNEGKNIQDLARVNSFTMREIIFFGDKEYVEQIRQTLIEELADIFKSWGFCYRIVSASDPFFAIQAEQKRFFQTLFKLKYELQIYLPYCEKWISVASFNNHQNTLIDSYNITSDSIANLASGCFGIGYERCVYGAYAQFGVNLQKWPKQLLSIIGEI